MLRWITSLILSLAVLVTASAADAQSTTDYYPLKKGNAWTYKAGKVVELQVKVSEVAEDGTATLDTVHNGMTVATEKVIVKEDGIYRSELAGMEISPPVKILSLKDKQPSADGTTWEIMADIGTSKLKGTSKKGSEKVKVPAGEFDAVVVDFDGEDVTLGLKTTARTWYAPKVGVVKISIKVLGNETVLELEKFTPGE